MNKEAQQIAIAEACGWSDFWVGELTGVYATDPSGQEAAVPDYLNDLNAMHEAQKILRGQQVDAFVTTLCLKVQPKPSLWDATAAQRAEAFLKALNLWKNT
jgi:hypothetical protein